jgi:hypothetical protein
MRGFLEFFATRIRSKNTRMAYYRAVCHFFAWSSSTASASWPTSSPSKTGALTDKPMHRIDGYL